MLKPNPYAFLLAPVIVPAGMVGLREKKVELSIHATIKFAEWGKVLRELGGKDSWMRVGLKGLGG